MRSIKKVLLIFALVFSIGALTACSAGTFQSVEANFEAEGYHTYEYKNPLAVNYDPERPNLDRLVASQIFNVVDNMTIDLIRDYENLEVFTEFNYAVYMVGYYEIDTDDVQTDKTAVIIEFPSIEHLEEALRLSSTLQNYYSSRDIEDYRRDNLLLIIHTEDYEAELVEIFNRTE